MLLDRWVSLSVSVGAIAVSAACGGSSGAAKPATPQAKSASPSASPSPSPSPSIAVALDASTVLEELKAAGLPITAPYIITAENDPNHLLGRPSGYTSKAAWVDPRVVAADRTAEVGAVENGGSVEVFSDPAGASARATYIGTIRKSSPALANEYDYVHGAVLVRVTGNLTPAQAAGYKTAVSGL